MAKYRLLTLDELKELQKEFVDYLVLNGITADEWERLKKEDVDAADKIINLFSDVVFESILRKINFLEFRTSTEIKVFQCLSDKLVMVTMVAGSGADVDFQDPEFIRKASVAPPNNLSLYTLDKPYTKDRELELFQMIESGCQITDGKLFKALCLNL